MQKSSSSIAGKKRSRDEGDDDKTNKQSQNASKSDTKKAKALDGSMKRTVNKMLTNYGSLPLSDLGLPNPSSANPENVLALVFNAMLTSARISHELAFKSVKCLIEAGYQDIKTLTGSTWEERTDGRRLHPVLDCPECTLGTEPLQYSPEVDTLATAKRLQQRLEIWRNLW